MNPRNIKCWELTFKLCVGMASFCFVADRSLNFTANDASESTEDVLANRCVRHLVAPSGTIGVSRRHEPAAGNRIVTAFEVLSPDNKRTGPGRDSYLQKREEYWQGGANLIEIDLLRAGDPTVRFATERLEQLRPWSYLVGISRVYPCRQEVFTIGLRCRLPRSPYLWLTMMLMLHWVYKLPSTAVGTKDPIPNDLATPIRRRESLSSTISSG